jgi:hypothetical protein
MIASKTPLSHLCFDIPVVPGIARRPAEETSNKVKEGRDLRRYKSSHRMITLYSESL